MAFKKGIIPEGAKPFKKGESGNPAGLPKGTLHLSTILKEMLNEDIIIVEDGEKKKKRLSDVIIRKLIKKATEGEIKAIQEILDRTEGKAGQHIEIRTSADYSRLSVKERELLRQLHQKAGNQDE